MSNFISSIFSIHELVDHSSSHIRVKFNRLKLNCVCPQFLAVEGTDPVRRDKLIELLDINLQWRMHKVSDGQRRRVQICMGLLHPFKVS